MVEQRLPGTPPVCIFATKLVVDDDAGPGSLCGRDVPPSSWMTTADRPDLQKCESPSAKRKHVNDGTPKR
jgi:hypothetical protein